MQGFDTKWDDVLFTKTTITNVFLNLYANQNINLYIIYQSWKTCTRSTTFLRETKKNLFWPCICKDSPEKRNGQFFTFLRKGPPSCRAENEGQKSTLAILSKGQQLGKETEIEIPKATRTIKDRNNSDCNQWSSKGQSSRGDSRSLKHDVNKQGTGKRI